MPLSPPSLARELLHVRQVECRGFRRDDGLYDIEGHLTDVKSYDFPSSFRGEVKAGEPVHEMWIRLTVDAELTVKAIEAVTDASPFPAVCPAITENFQRVVGLTIGKGWSRALRERLGGVDGCTHLVELLGPIATTAFQTVHSSKSREKPPAPDKPGRFPLLNTCHAFRSDSPVVKALAPDSYTGEKD